MVTILFNKTYSYVPSNHPYLFQHLSKLNEGVKAVDAGRKELVELYSIIDASDLIVLDQTLLNSSDMSSKKQGRNHIHMYFPVLKDAVFYKSLLTYLFDSSKKIIYWASLTDPHGILTVDMAKILTAGISVESMLNRIDGVIWQCNSATITDLKNVDPLYKEKWFDTAENPSASFATIKRHCRYEIEMIHCIEEQEFHSRKKKWDIDIPGVQYSTRQMADKSLEETSVTRPVKKNSSYWNGKVNSLILKAGFLPSTMIFRNNYRWMRYFISRSRITFVCGGGLKYFVRKFVEVPAFESVMLAYPPDNIADYGFVDGEHYLKSDPANIKPIVEMLLDSPAKQEELIHNALLLAKKNHTVQVRCRQLVKGLQLINQDKIDKACFENGKFIYLCGQKKISD